MPPAMLCPTCSHASASGSRFCSVCGQALEGLAPAQAIAPVQPQLAEPAAGERRRATVMFSDLAGYTALTERLDPEEVDEILMQIKQTARRVVEKHGGTVNQFVGDEIMALFGVPTADEDDAVNAIKAALELHAQINANAQQWQTGERLAIHTGISSGLIIAQYENQHAGLYRSTGDAVNMAARLRSLAAADQVLVSPSTQRLAAPYFELEPQPAVVVKGKSEPIVPYLVVAESKISSRFDAARERGFKGYVGRALEMQTLQSSLARALGGEGQLVTIEGDPGIGKTRLIYQFLSAIDREQIVISQGRCQPHGSDTPYFCFLDGLRHGLDLSEHDSHADALRKAVANIERIDPSLKTFLPHVLELLSIPSDYALPADVKGEALRRAMGEALVSIITVATKTRPMVFVIEDWHWSDPTSQSALSYLLRLVPSHRLLVVVSFRPGYAFEFGAIGRRTAIRVNPLNEAETEGLILTVTGAAALPSGLGALICQGADGNPLFIEEACRSLLESRAISVADEALVLHQALDRLLLPDTVQAVIRARLDRLDAGAKEVVGLASVVGREFNQRILARMYRGRTPLEEALFALQAQEIIRQTKIRPEPEYSFRHVLTREVAYETLLHQQRKHLHAEVGAAIEAFYPERLAENASILAHHYARSPRADKAVQFALLAGDRAARLFANAEAATYFDDALTLARTLPKSPDAQRAQIDAILGQVAAGIAPRDMQRDRQNLEHACATAVELNDRPRLARALYWSGRNQYVLAHLEQAIEYAQQSLDLADALGDAALAAPPVNLMGRAYWQLSDFAKSAQMMERSVEQMRLLGDMSEESTAAGFVSALFGYMGEFDKALHYSDRSIKLARELKNPYAEAAGFHYRGIIRDQQGQWDAAFADYATAQKAAEGAGDMFRIYIVKFMEGRALHMTGESLAGQRYIEDSIALAGRIGTTFLLGQAKSFLAACCVGAGDGARVRTLCTEAIDLAGKAGDKFTEALARRAHAEALCRYGEPHEHAAMKQLMQDAMALQQGIGAKPELARSYLSYACILSKASGSEQQAAAYLEQATRLFGELAMDWDIAAAARAFEAAVAGRG